MCVRIIASTDQNTVGKWISQQRKELIFKADLHVENSRQTGPSETTRDDFSRLKTQHDEADRARQRQLAEDRQRMAAGSGSSEEESQRKLNRSQRRAKEGPKKKSLYGR